jgi:hypothetical protein
MRRLTSSAALAALVAVALLAPAAPAQNGNGLYEPFPQGAAKKRAKRFVSRLPTRVRFSDKDLARGVFLADRALPRTEAAPAASRAGVDKRSGGSSGTALQLALVALPVAGACALARRRRSGRVAST